MIPLPNLNLGSRADSGTGPVTFGNVFLNSSGTGASGGSSVGVSWWLIAAIAAAAAWFLWKFRK